MRAAKVLLPVALLLLVAMGCTKKTEENKGGKEGEPTVGTEPGKNLPTGPAAAGQPTFKQVKEVEPNEESGQAMDIKESVIVDATLEPAAKPNAAAKDWYKIVPPAKQVVKVELTGIPDEDIKITFYDADRNKLLLLDSGGKGEGESYPNLTVDKAAYLLVNGSEGGKGGPYRLTVAMGDPKPGEEVEINDKYSLATPMKVGEPMKGYLSHRRDEDWYLLSLKDLATGSVLRLDLTPVEGVRFELAVMDQAQQAPILSVKSAETGKGLVVRNLGVPGNPEGVYLVVKSAWVPTSDPKKYVQTFNPTAMYSLSVSSEAGGDDLEREPDDDAAHAIPLVDGQKIRGYLSSPNDVDWYKINVERPSILSGELSALPRVDLVLFVVNPDKKEEQKNFELCRVNNGGVNEPEVLTNCALGPGENYVRIEGAWKNVDGKWIRDFENLDETYTLTVALRTDEGKEEREPNDSADKATSIKVGDTLRGTLHPKGDVDYYKLDLTGQDGPRNTLIECSGIPKLAIGLTLLSGDKDEKGKNKELASAGKDKPETKTQVQKELLPGEYWIVVRGSPATESNTRDQYLLTVTQP